jgi:malyl-CoA/(S)-citramalyl-CoA lyase
MTVLSDYNFSSKEVSLTCIADACRAYGLRAIDGPCANYGDPTGFRAGVERASALGCEGKWASTLRWSRWRTGYLYRLRRNSAGLKASSVPLRWRPKPALAAFSRYGVLIDMALEKIARSLIERAEAVSRADTPTLQAGATHAG